MNLNLLLSGMVVNAHAVYKWGCDYELGGKSSGTLLNKNCKDVIWMYPDGTLVPTSEIICCNWAGDSYTGIGGVNCPFGRPKNPKDITGTNYFGNYYINSEIKVAIDGNNGNVVLVDYTTSLKLNLLTPSQMLGDDVPINIQFSLENNKLIVNYKLVEDTTIVDSNGLTIGSIKIEFDLHDVIAQLYQVNISNIISITPNPVTINTNYTIYNKLAQFGKVLELRIYDLNGLSYGTYTLIESQNQLPGLPNVGYYRFIIFDQTNGNQIGHHDYGFVNILTVPAD